MVNYDIFLGDRAFLSRYNCKLKKDQIHEIFNDVWNSSNLGLCSGDVITANIINEIIDKNHSERFIYHSRFLIKIINKENKHEFSEKFIQSKIIDFYRIKNVDFFVNESQILEDIDIVEKLKPGKVTIGGDWLDILLSQQKYDLIDSILSKMEFNSNVEKILLTFNLSASHIEILKRYNFLSIAMPINIFDIGNTNKEKIIQLLKKSHRIYAIHVLGGGNIPFDPAMDYVFNHAQINSAIVGASKKHQIEKLINYGYKS